MDGRQSERRRAMVGWLNEPAAAADGERFFTRMRAARYEEAFLRRRCCIRSASPDLEHTAAATVHRGNCARLHCEQVAFRD